MRFDLKNFANAVSELAEKFPEEKVSAVLDAISPVDVIEAGYELEGTHIPDADAVFDLTVGKLYEYLEAA